MSSLVLQISKNTSGHWFSIVNITDFVDSLNDDDCDRIHEELQNIECGSPTDTTAEDKYFEVMDEIDEILERYGLEVESTWNNSVKDPYAFADVNYIDVRIKRYA